MTDDLESGASERLVELGGILADGLMRALEAKSSPKSSAPGEVSLDFSGVQSGHAPPDNERTRNA
jgi:hypothetical protein